MTFWRDGYELLRGVFTASQVAQWRSRALEAAGPADLLSDPLLRDVVLNPLLIDQARTILGGDPIYFGDSIAMVGGPQFGGFHKDCSDRYDGAAPDWQVERYPLIRFGIYTQKHADMPGGLDLRSGSHNYPDISSGDWFSADTLPGDVIVWNGRTTHSGPSAVLKGGHRVEPNGMAWRLLSRFPASQRLLRRHPQQRVALFVTYGIEHPLLDRHIAYLRTRTYAVESWRASHWAPDVHIIAAERGLKLILPEKRLTGVGQTNDDYVQLGYR